MAFVDKIRDSKTIELVTLAQFKDSADGGGDGLERAVILVLKGALREDFLDVDLNRNAARAGLRGNILRNVYGYFHASIIRQ
jgi:hypothetical protein